MVYAVIALKNHREMSSIYTMLDLPNHRQKPGLNHGIKGFRQLENFFSRDHAINSVILSILYDD